MLIFIPINIPFKATGYYITTIDDISVYPGKNSKIWILKGKKNEDSDQAVIDSITNSSQDHITI